MVLSFESRRLSLLPPYLFARLDAQKREALAAGVDVIDFGVGDPDLPSPDEAVAALCEAAKHSKNHRYPPYRGTLEFREACARWLLTRHEVRIDPETEVLGLIGSKEGLAHLALGIVNSSDVVLCPDPGYPVYLASTILAGGEPFRIPLLAERGFLPDLSAVPQKIVERASLMFLNYPNNPTGACASASFLNEAVGFARANDMVVCHDAAYIDVALEGPKQKCMLATCRDKSNIIELFSFSKTFNMTGWRVAFAAGDPELISALGKVKTNLDSGAFMPIQTAVIEAMQKCDDFPNRMGEVYRERRDILLPALAKAGIDAKPPRAAFYVWGRIRKDIGSATLAEQILARCGILAAPGVAFGRHGEGYLRFSLTLSTERVREAADRLSRVSF
ncbi:MAG: aminotransferase class I/II-fold pyridoxal phosphate-dependent enzyme [Candidatus Coatesbacteria bacterium]|nr:aminotransferase class I/II-fold pyridoxal phosphate-dependent enzyme [Candidatus Coatesbacteria bacterium]